MFIVWLERRVSAKIQKTKWILRSRRNADDLAAFIKATSRANPVRDVGRGALRAGAELRQFQHAVVGTAHALPAPGWFTFWNAHKILDLKFQFVQFSPRGRVLFVHRIFC